MKDYLKEQNMRRENDPVTTTLDVGLNNNQLERENQSLTGTEDTENENFWLTENVGLSANYEWCCESGSSIDDPEESTSSEYSWDEDDRPNNWKDETADEKSSDWRESSEDITTEDSTTRETSGELGYFWNNTENRDENEFNNNGAGHRSIAGESLNQLDTRKSEEKIFYEKPKLNIQTVTFLYDSVLTPTVKFMNYVNSIKDTDSLDNTSAASKKNLPESELPAAKEFEKIEIARIDDTSIKSKEIADETSKWESANKKNEIEVVVDVEVVELTKSVKEIIQFPEIEEIVETIKSIDQTETVRPTEEDSATIDHIDLIREAEELTIEEKSKDRKGDLPIFTKIDDIDDRELNGETICDHFYDEQSSYAKIEEIDLLSSIGRDIGVDLEKYVQPVPDVVAMETVKQTGPRSLPSLLKDSKIRNDTNKLVDYDLPDVSSADTRKKEKMARNQARRRQNTNTGQTRRPDKRRADHIADNGPDGFDVYNIETAMPKIDLDAIESHLRAAREEERRETELVAEVVEAVTVRREPESNNSEKEDLLSRFNRLLEGDTSVSLQRRNDREEIRRRLAMGPDAEDLRTERGRKPSLQSRLQSGMNLQICFMNETPSDTESPGSENDSSSSSAPLPISSFSKFQNSQLASRPQILSLPSLRVETGSSSSSMPLDEADFFARQARLQTEARMALAQAKEMAHMQMEVERQRLKQSPITEMVRSSLEKVGVQLGEDRRRLSRVLLTELNVAQLQVVANDLHARIAMLNEALVEGLLRRDDLHMEQDSMLVDVEDLTRYLAAKQESPKKRSRTRKHRQRPNNVPINSSNVSKSRANPSASLGKNSLTRERILKCLSTRRAA